MSKNWYIASCVFTERFPALSLKVQDYARARGLEIVRCCVPNYKLAEFEGRISEPEAHGRWTELPDSGDFRPGDGIYALCHNCLNIAEEWRHAPARSLWEFILEDEDFPLPDLTGRRFVVQDCWRSRDRAQEQAAVRALLVRAGAEVLEAPIHGPDTRFCGLSLYRPQPPRNPSLAPKHYVEGAEGLFAPHTQEEQTALMREYCATLGDDEVVCYCHYCLEGLIAGGAKAMHLAQLLF